MADVEERPETPSGKKEGGNEMGGKKTKISEAQMEGMSDFARKRLEKDLIELERLIKDHFNQRKKDEEDLAQLQDRIEKRKTVREEQLKARAEKEKLRLEQDKVCQLINFNNYYNN